jgi:hypothetical protein
MTATPDPERADDFARDAVGRLAALVGVSLPAVNDEQEQRLADAMNTLHRLARGDDIADRDGWEAVSYLGNYVRARLDVVVDTDRQRRWNRRIVCMRAESTDHLVLIFEDNSWEIAGTLTGDALGRRSRGRADG